VEETTAISTLRVVERARKEEKYQDREEAKEINLKKTTVPRPFLFVRVVVVVAVFLFYTIIPISYVTETSRVGGMPIDLSRRYLELLYSTPAASGNTPYKGYRRETVL